MRLRTLHENAPGQVKADQNQQRQARDAERKREAHDKALSDARKNAEQRDREADRARRDEDRARREAEKRARGQEQAQRATQAMRLQRRQHRENERDRLESADQKHVTRTNPVTDTKGGSGVKAIAIGNKGTAIGKNPTAIGGKGATIGAVASNLSVRAPQPHPLATSAQRRRPEPARAWGELAFLDRQRLLARHRF